MIEGSNLNEKEISYPAEVVFKAIFRNREFTLQTLTTILTENNITGKIDSRESKNGKFVSFTISGTFCSKEELNSVCTKVTMVEGFMSMF